jgi:hypothetical protein
MAALIIPNQTTFGAMTNQMVSRIASLDSTMKRLSEAIATASAGYSGTPGTQFEAPSIGAQLPPTPVPPPNNFGITPNPDTPGQKGQDYAYAVGRLHDEWATFWAAAQPFVAALDNGNQGL